MAFNISGSGKEVLPDQQFYTTGMGETEMVLIAHENKRLLKNKLMVNQNYFGFGWNIYSKLHRIELEKIVTSDVKDIQEFFERNTSVLNEKEFTREMVGIFKSNKIN